MRGSQIKRPSQILGSILLFDGVDVALDNGAVSEAEQGLDGIRARLATATVVWDRHSDRRDSERTDCDLDIQVRFVSRDSMDEELKSSYQEGDGKFNQAFEELAAGVPSEVGHVQNLCAESAPKKSESKARGTIKQGTKAAPGQKSPGQEEGRKAAAAGGEKGEANMRPRRKKRRRPDAAFKANGNG